MQSTSDVYSDLDGQTALVTGASKNIGREIAVALGEAGVDVGVTAKSDVDGCEETMALIEETGNNAAYELGDLSNPDDITDIIEGVRTELGQIDILVNNAAIRPHVPFEELSVEEWDRIQNTNLRSAFISAREVIPDMVDAGRGSIVHISGLVGVQGRQNATATTVSKAGLFGLTRSLAADYGPEGIRVNNVVPGRKLKTSRGGLSEKNEEHFRVIEAATPLRRRAEPREVGKVVRFVASEEASYVNGEVIKVDGGLSNSQTGAHLF